MKAKIDKLIVSEKHLQRFLETIYSTSSQVQSDSKPASLRSFYFAAYAKSTSIFTQENNLDMINQITSDLELDNNITLGSSYFTKLPNINTIYFHACKSLFPNHRRQISQPNFEIRNDDFTNFIKQSRNYSLINGDAIESFIKNDYQSWAENLTKAIVDDNSNTWEFNDVQEELLRKYYIGNKLLSECLTRASSVNIQLLQEIEDNLLLPIAEIEKRKREKAE